MSITTTVTTTEAPKAVTTTVTEITVVPHIIYLDPIIAAILIGFGLGIVVLVIFYTVRAWNRR